MDYKRRESYLAINYKNIDFLILEYSPKLKDMRFKHNLTITYNMYYINIWTATVVKWSEFLATDPDVRVRFPALPDSLRNCRFGTGSATSREYS
jgi:hypothetical protein